VKQVQRLERLEARRNRVPSVAMIVMVDLKPGDDREARVAEEVRRLEKERGYRRRSNEGLIVIASGDAGEAAGRGITGFAARLSP
jgi:hypothetical protein